MDVVVTYVDNLDENWKNEFIKYHNGEFNITNNESRYTANYNLKYLLRSIDRYMPFIRKVHLIVSSESQVPDWIDTNSVNIVFHKDIIPEEYLPTFNSRTIEMCMHNITTLDEEFIYFNDDMFIVRNCTPNDFFVNGKPNSVINKYTEEELKKIWGRMDIYFNPHKRCNDDVKEILNIKDDNYYLTNHGPCPMLKSNNRELFEKLKDKILPTLGRFRTANDYVHFMYSIYSYLKGDTNKDIYLDNEYLKDNINIKDLTKNILYPNKKCVCVNDITTTAENADYKRVFYDILKDIFDICLPNLSKYEKAPKVSLCVIVKNENKYLKEYVNHYLNLGFKKIYLYDNNDVDGENPKTVLNDYINKGYVVYHNYRGQKVCQIKAYNDCYLSYSNECDWIAFYDADEFIELNRHKNISSFISQYKFNGDVKYNCILLNWICYGDNGHVYYDNRPLSHRFTKPVETTTFINFNVPLNSYHKSIVKTGQTRLSFIDSVHLPSGGNLKCCDVSGNSVISCNSHIHNSGEAYIKHYITKSLEEYIEKINRGYPDHVVNVNQKIKYLERYFLINKETKEKRIILNKEIKKYKK